MSFFKDLKEDIAQSMNELSESFDEGFLKDGEDPQTASDADMAGTVPEGEIPTGEMVTDFDGYAQTESTEIPDAAGVQDFKVAEEVSQTGSEPADADALSFEIPDLETGMEAEADVSEPQMDEILPEAGMDNLMETEVDDFTQAADMEAVDVESESVDAEDATPADTVTGDLDVLSGLMPETESTEDVLAASEEESAGMDELDAGLDLTDVSDADGFVAAENTVVSDNVSDLEPDFNYDDENTIIPQEESADMDTMNEEFNMPEEPVTDTITADEAEPEVTIITKGTTINGGIKSDTSLVVKGTIEGDVECDGKLTITGRVSGNTIASEIYVNTPRLEGDINSKGIVKIDVGTVVIGNISCTSVLVSGAVKGNIEVNGPVIIDSTAVVKGDIKAKSIQINSGAVIDGHCSLQYADIDLDSFFE